MPEEVITEMGAALENKADNVRRNGWNGVEDAKSAAGDVALGNAPEFIGPATIGLAGLVRPLTSRDLGLASSIYVKGELAVDDTGVATVRVDMLAGDVDNPFAIVKSLSNVVRQEGANVLRIEATVVNPRLYNILINRYDMVTVGGYDYIVIPLR